MNPLAENVIWTPTGDARLPWEASVGGRRWQVRVNEFPEEPYVYSLLIEGAVAEHFNLWPSHWVQPPAPRGQASPQASDEDPVERAEYEAEMEKFERTRKIPPSKLVEPPPSRSKPPASAGPPKFDIAHLPDLPGKEIVLHWDESGGNSLVLHGKRVLWKEASYFENYDRYLEVGKILLQKYGIRLKDFEPTGVSEYNLFGDTSRASGEVDYFRKSLTLEGLTGLINNLPEDFELRRRYAERVRATDPARAELIEAQLAVREAFRRGENPEAEKDRAEKLIRRNGYQWSRGISELVERSRFMAGFIEYVEATAAQFIESAASLAKLAPIRHARLSQAKGQIAALIKLPILGQLASLDLTGCRLDDGDLAELVSFPYRLRNLRLLRLVSNPEIGMEGMRALARANLQELRFVEASGTEAPLYIRTYDWGGSLTEEEWTRARATLVEEFGHKPWLDEMDEPPLESI